MQPITPKFVPTLIAFLLPALIAGFLPYPGLPSLPTAVYQIISQK